MPARVARSTLDETRASIQHWKAALQATSRANQKQEAEAAVRVSQELEAFDASSNGDLKAELNVPLPHTSGSCTSCAAPVPTLEWQHPGARMGQARSLTSALKLESREILGNNS